MPQIFRPWANDVARLILLGALIGSSLIIIAGWLYIRSSYATHTFFAYEQPVPFSHKHHIGGLGLDCRYCHYSVESSSFAGMPSTDTCMTCHSQIWTNAAVLAPLRESLARNEPLRWRRVNSVGDFVYFNHAIHVNKGVGCVTCHGEVDAMPLTWRAHTLKMEWCLACHRDPAPYLRPKDAVFDLHWSPPKDGQRLRQELMSLYDIHPEHMTDCYVCHR